jgi:Fur family ferric uptake transcriptional regulator
MSGDQDDWHETLRRHIKEQGLRLTPQRMMIAEAFFELAAGEHLNIDELYRLVRERNPAIGYATVYRTLKLLEECDLAVAAQFGDKTTRFEPRNPDSEDHHDHIICTSCGLIVEFENEEIEALQEQMAARYGFSLTHHKMELYGLCERCRSSS